MSVRDRIGQIGVQVTESLARRTYELSQKYVPVASGKLKKSGRVRKRGKTWEVAYTARHAAVVNYGREGGTERVRSFTVKRHRRRLGARTIMVKRHKVRSFRRRVKSREGTFFLTRAYDQALAHQMKAELLQAVQQASRK